MKFASKDRVGIDVGEADLTPEIQRGIGGGSEGNRARQDGPPRTDAGGEIGAMEGRGPAVERHGVTGAGDVDQPSLELLNSRPLGEKGVAKRVHHGGDVLVSDLLPSVGNRLHR
jgi:hypothetical protein